MFAILWATFIYAPLAHWVWGGGWLGDLGDLDFAGGTVVHISSGVAALACALALGKRRGYGSENMAPHNLPLTLVGASLLWVGWFGFNAGSALAADGIASSAFVATHVATAAGALAVDHRGVGVPGKPNPVRRSQRSWLLAWLPLPPRRVLSGPFLPFGLGWVAGWLVTWES